MSIGFDPVVSSFLFTAGLVPHAARPHAELELPERPGAEAPPLVTVILALFREKWSDIVMTVESLTRQSYPRDRLEVFIAIEASDVDIEPLAEAARRKLLDAGIESRIVVSSGGRVKARALNRSIEDARGEICAFYDASDDIEPTQIEKAALLMHQKQYDAVQATVLRKGPSILSNFLLIDTAFWFRKYIPFVLGLAGGMPLSGEGLFLRTAVLREVGGFPEVLTEDAYLGIMLTERGKRFGLVSSVITEKAPRNIRAHFLQRLRWNRGYLTCLLRLVRSNLSLKRKLALSLPFLTPLSCALAFLGWILILGQGAVTMVSGVVIPNATFSLVQHPLYANVMYYWALVLFICGLPLCVTSYVHTLWVLGMKRHAPVVLLLPYYWTFIGFAATCSFFKRTTVWGRTER